MSPTARTELDRLLTEGIKPHAAEIAQIAADGDVALVFYEPRGEAVPLARQHGWPDCCVTRLPKQMKEALAGSDDLTRSWLESSREGVARMLVFMHVGSLLVNYHPDTGYWIEHGSLDGADN